MAARECQANTVPLTGLGAAQRGHRTVGYQTARKRGRVALKQLNLWSFKQPRHTASTSSTCTRCPVCRASVPQSQLDNHLDHRCCSSMSPGSPPKLTESSIDAALESVKCPVCGLDMPEKDINAHLDDGACEPIALECVEDAQAQARSPDRRQAMGFPAQELVVCPCCYSQVLADDLDCHLDRCGVPGADEEVPTSQLRRGDVRELAADITCAICLSIFDSPASLPCQHSFCWDCAQNAMRTTKRQECALGCGVVAVERSPQLPLPPFLGMCAGPLCKAPTWRRQVTRNQTLAAIVDTYRRLEAAEESRVPGGDSP